MMNMPTDIPAQDDTADRLIEALNQDAFVLYQQAIRPIRPGSRADGYQEILIRFREEEEKLLPPGTFIPVLESSNLMHVLDRWVVNRVIKWIHARRRADPLWNAPCSSINVSSDSLQRAEFPGFIRQQLQKGRVSGRKFAFEIAEEDGERHIDALGELGRALKTEGCGLTLTSYTGHLVQPSRLEALNVDSVKLDIDIVTTLLTSAKSQQRAAWLQEQCAALGVRTIAEFVEQPETMQKLRSIGIDYAQGYGIEMPAALV